VALNFFKRRSILKKLNYMDATPVRRSEYETAENGIVTLIVPKFKNLKLNDFLFHPHKRFFRISLDQLGSAVWTQIDGRTKVAEICKKALEICGEHINPVEQRVTKFLTTLYEARYITFVEIEKEENKY
jgi:hypothetical protein